MRARALHLANAAPSVIFHVNGITVKEAGSRSAGKDDGDTYVSRPSRATIAAHEIC